MLPLGCLGWLLSGVELQVPVLDQWALPNFFARVSGGAAGLADLLAPLGKTLHRSRYLAFSLPSWLCFELEPCLGTVSEPLAGRGDPSSVLADRDP